MSFMYQSYQKVPGRVIKAIGEEIQRNFELRIRASRSTEEINDLLTNFELAIAQVSTENAPSVDGYKLCDQVVAEIGELLRQNKRIPAIKEFRMATGAGLREAKYFIDKFASGEEGFIQFTNAFSG